MEKKNLIFALLSGELRLHVIVVIERLVEVSHPYLRCVVLDSFS